MKNMFTNMKKNFAKKGLVTFWLVFTTLYTIYGVYNYFKFSVYQAGANAMVVQIMNDVANKQCQQATQLNAGNAQMNLVDFACIQQAQQQAQQQVPAVEEEAAQ